ncbi:MAG: hypothetical protein CVT62_07650 [Actinobacteria bacterium HGW-Actinobacteria-2]|nr:MAG: hypothetical protein CVT62_07650 [Actinobacteria bacterium HGW-Actinobacteria-2]
MKAAAAAQLRLLDLQAEDTAIAQLTHRKTTLPEHAAIVDGKAQRATLAASLVEVRTRLSDYKLEVEKAEADLVPVRERLARDIKRRDDGLVTDPRGFAALNEEIEHLGKRISDLEDTELEAMENLETAAASEAELAAQLTDLENSVRAVIAARDEQLAQADAQIAAHTAARDAIVAELPADLVALYDRIRVKAGGLGAAELKGRRCAGCQIEATSAALTGYLEASADDVVRCEECDRILVRSSAAGA